MRSEHGKPLTDWMGAMPRFASDAPPKDWERQHARRLSKDGLAPRNRPVPRLASHHYASDRVAGYTPRRDSGTFLFA